METKNAKDETLRWRNIIIFDIALVHCGTMQSWDSLQADYP